MLHPVKLFMMQEKENGTLVSVPNEDLFETIFDHSREAMAVLEAIYGKDGSICDFRYVQVNQMFTELLTIDHLGRTFLGTNQHEVEWEIFTDLKAVMETGGSLDREFCFDKGEAVKWFHITARRKGDFLITGLEDITDRKMEAEALRENLRFKQELSQASTEVMMIMNLSKFHVRYINRDVLPEIGMTREKIQEMRLEEVLLYINPRDRKKLLEMHRKLLKTQGDKVHEVNLRVRMKDNSWAWFRVRGKVFNRRDENWVEEYLLLASDITIEKRTERALKKARNLSIQGEVARTLAHELRNPIASIGMVKDVLWKKAGELGCKEELSNYLDILGRSSSTLNEMVSDLLNSANYAPSELKKKDLSNIVENAVLKASDRIYLEGITVEKEFDGSFPILADQEKLEIALLNLLVNASEATVPGKGVIKIEIQDSEHDFMLCISDNGHGIEEDQIERLFEAFYSNKRMGVGVGLSSVKDILEQHDAKIKVLSTPGKGTTFRMLFPKCEE